eukprot:GHVP01004823.1.p1 GENE.GHVP01004823.1~~GHVP01004823.1.p1  ORF type:complete len:128 (-),score=23.24 GHVP01004823.1:221-559(-)
MKLKDSPEPPTGCTKETPEDSSEPPTGCTFAEEQEQQAEARKAENRKLFGSNSNLQQADSTALSYSLWESDIFQEWRKEKVKNFMMSSYDIFNSQPRGSRVNQTDESSQDCF